MVLEPSCEGCAHERVVTCNRTCGGLGCVRMSGQLADAAPAPWAQMRPAVHLLECGMSGTACSALCEQGCVSSGPWGSCVQGCMQVTLVTLCRAGASNDLSSYPCTFWV